jgi:uncharacterized protein YndB with AHSA1/START domain
LVGAGRFSTTTQEFDLRPGGSWRLTMRAPDGQLFQNRIIFDNLDPPSRIVYRHVPEPGTVPVAFQVTIELTPHGNDTGVAMTFRFATPALRRFVTETYGAEQGNRETLNRLEAHLHSVRHPPIFRVHANAPEFRAVRELRAPIRRAWDALTIPEQLSRWWGGR